MANIQRRYKLAVIASHPIQYQSPLWKKLAADPRIDLMVYYCVDWGVSKPQFHKDFFNTSYKWDVPLLDGYRYKFLRNYSPKPGPYLGGFINPGIFLELWRNNYDAVLILGWMDVTFWFAFFAAKVKGVPVLLRTVNSLYYDRHVKRSSFLLLLKKAYLYVLFHVFVSGFLAIGTWNRNMYLRYGVSREHVFHFPYAVDNDFFLSESALHRKNREKIRKQLGLQRGDVVITFAARFVEEKHPEHIIYAFEKLQNVPHLALLMIGDGPRRQFLEDEVERRTLQRIHFLGFQNQRELVKYYAISDIFVRADGPHKGDWGATVNEAMACGLPIVCTSTIGSQKDLVQEGKNGFVYELGDIDRLAGIIRKIAFDRKLLSEMKRCSLALISSWSYNEDVAGLIKALRKLV